MARGVRFLPPGAAVPTTLPIVADGVTYTMAQEVSWLDEHHFAVGRWDGSLSIFAFNDSPTAGPMITKAVNTPALEGVQMITWMAPGVFCSSNNESSLSVWASPSRQWTDMQEIASPLYDKTWGVANSGESLSFRDRLYLFVGHANGFVSLWEYAPDGSHFELLKAVDVRNPSPTNPWGLHNIRGIGPFLSNASASHVVAGSEDGFLSVLRIPDGELVSQTLYNPAALRGINSVAVLGFDVLVANCSVGEDDKNLWYYTVDPRDWSITLKDSRNLRVNPSSPQVFNFCAIWGQTEGRPCFFSSTEEGVLWMGRIDSGQMVVLGYQTVYGNLGSAMAFNASGKLVVVNHNLYEFRTEVRSTIDPDQHPEHLLSTARTRL